MTEPDQLLTALKQHYGYDSFRPQQRETIEHVLSGGDALVLMPTGGGKSLCYQLPALLTDGLTVVVSPLIALMQDQVTALQSSGASAHYLNSTMSPMESAQVERMVVDGSVKLLYVAPERVNTDGFRRLLERRPPSLIAIDEAHCISEWGHEFRPDYRVLRRFTERFVDVPTVACTATATPQVQRDIVEQLDRPRMQTYLTSFMRENLTLRVVPKRKSVDRLAARLKEITDGSVIVYSQSRRNTEKTANDLNQRGIQAEYYHAGMSGAARQAVQNRFLHGETPVICATIAFGMGIDKPDIRVVAHLDMPSSMESYYQEIGRAGRDGQPAECLMFFTKGIWHQQLYFIDQLQDEQEKQQRIKRLRRMMNFSDQSDCRWTTLLRYFGESPQSQQCMHCDNCLSPSGEEQYEEVQRVVDPADPPEPPGQTELRPLTAQEDQLYEALRQTRLRLAREEGVSAFVVAGNRALAELARKQPQTAAQMSQVKGFGKKRVEKYGTEMLAVIAEFSGKNGSNESSPELPLDMETTVDSDPTQERPPEPWQQRFNALAEWRRLTSENEQCTPSDLLSFAAMRNLAEHPPTDLNGLSAIEGIGALALERYSEELALIAGIASTPAEPPAPKPQPQLQSDTANKPSWQVSADLYKSGHTMLAIAERRMLSPGAIASHLIHAIKNGIAIDLAPELPVTEQVQRVRRLLGEDSDRSVTSVQEQLDYQLSNAELRIVIAHLRPPEPIEDQ